MDRWEPVDSADTVGVSLGLRHVADAARRLWDAG